MSTSIWRSNVCLGYWHEPAQTPQSTPVEMLWWNVGHLGMLSYSSRQLY